jgi:hypothetical protein
MNAKLAAPVLILPLLAPPSARAAAGDIWDYDPGSFSTGVQDTGLWVGPFDLSPGTPRGPYSPVHGALFSYGDSGKVVVWRDTVFVFFDLNVANSRTDVDIGSQYDWDEVHHSFCSGHAFFEGSSGPSKLLVAGGDHFVVNEGNPQSLTCPGTHCFPDSWTSVIDPSNNSVMLTNDFNSPPRWYPTLVTLPTGEVLMAAGDYWDPAKENGDGLYSNGEVSPVFEWERFDSSSEQWSTQGMLLGDSVQVKNYGFFQVLPKGLFFEGPRATYPATNSAFVFPWPATTYDDTNWIITDRQSGHPGGSAVLLTLEPPYTSSIVMMLGGGGDCSPKEFVQWKDPSSTSPTFWSKADSLKHRRMSPNAVLLPDGKVLAIGGSDTTNTGGVCDPYIAVFECELFDPEANGGPGSANGGLWTPVAHLTNPRMYHSISFLLPDSRILSAGNEGGAQYGDTEVGDSYEIYYPPYLFNASGTALATRPNITSAPANVHYGLPFEIDVDVAGDAITEVTLHRPSSVTHSNDMTQRRVALEFAVVDTAGGQLFATAPWQPEIAPPGDYMLFVLQDGVPSHARFVKLSWATSTAQTGANTVWGGTARPHRDFTVEEDDTLTVLPGTAVVAADSTDRGGGGDYPDLVEMILRGLFRADGDSAYPIVFRGTDTTSVSPWGGFRLDYQGSQMGYGYDNTGIMDWVTVRDAAKGIAIENIGAPSLSNITFRNNEVADIYVDSTDVEIPYSGGWSLQGPTRVLVTTATKPGRDIVQLPDTLGPGKVDFQAYGKVTAVGDASNLVSFLPDATSPATGDLWGGFYVDWTADGSRFEHVDIGYAEIPLFLFYQNGTTPTVVRYSEIHHFKDTGIWTSNASGAGVVVEGNDIFRDVPSGVLAASHGKTGIVIEKSSSATVRDNVITLQGMNSSVGGAGVEILGSKTYCLTNPASPESVSVENNDVIGPGGGAVIGGGKWAGMSGNWACGAPNRRVYLGANLIYGWNQAAFDLLQCSNVQVTCNDADSSAAGIAFSRNTAPSGVGVRFRHNKVRLVDYDASDTTATLISTDNASKLNLGPSTSTKGVNEFIVRGTDRYVLEEDTSADSLDAQNNYWKRNGIYHGVVDSILTYVDPDTARVAVSNPLADDYGQPTCSPGAMTLARPGQAVLDGDAGERETSITRLSAESVRTELMSTAPNPSAGGTDVRFSVGSDTEAVRVEVFDVTGRRVRRLVDGFVTPGTYRVSWTGSDERGSRVAAGVYFLRMTSGDYTKVQKVVRLR